MPIEPGDAFLFDPDGTNQSHLWVVVAKYDEGGEFAVAVHITTLTPRTQRPHLACVIRSADPDCYRAFIRVDSYVLYSNIRDFDIVRLAELSAHGRVSPELLTRIRKGLHASQLTRRRFKSIVPRE